MSAINIKGLDHVVLRVADLEKSMAFYCGVLGCVEVRRRPETGLYQFRAGISMVDLVPLDSPGGRRGGAGPGKEGRNMAHFCFNLTAFDEDAIRAQLAAHGIEVKKSGNRFGAEGTGPSIYMDDPDGNEVEIKGPCN